MKSTVTILLASAAFSAVVGVVYWIASHEPAGAFMLLTMMAGLAFAAAYVALLRRRTSLLADRGDVDPDEAIGEPIGIFASRSPWPVVLAVSCAFGLTGLLYSWWFVVLGGAGAAWALIGLMRQDRSVPSR